MSQATIDSILSSNGLDGNTGENHKADLGLPHQATGNAAETADGKETHTGLKPMGKVRKRHRPWPLE